MAVTNRELWVRVESGVGTRKERAGWKKRGSEEEKKFRKKKRTAGDKNEREIGKMA